MLSREQVLQILRKELPYFSAEYGVKRIGLFGSYARGTQQENSDIDLLVEFEKPIGLEFIEFGERVEQLLGQKTDILTPTGLKNIRVKRVAREIEENIVYV